jgi:hypothetical protein
MGNRATTVQPRRNAMAKRLYGLFIKENGKWVRQFETVSFSKETAIRVFQNKLLEYSFAGKNPALRPVKE